MQTTPPIVSASTLYAFAVHPATRNIAHVAISVAIVMPLTGFDELPISPLIRDATVTNKNPNTTTNTAAIRFANAPVCAPGIGLNFSSAHIIAISTTEPTSTTRIEMSRSVRATPESASCFARTSFNPAVSAAQIVGRVLISVISPEAATAPAPIGRM